MACEIAARVRSSSSRVVVLLYPRMRPRVQRLRFRRRRRRRSEYNTAIDVVMTGDGRKSGRERRGEKEVLALTSQLRSVGFLLLLNQMIVPLPPRRRDQEHESPC